MLPKVNLILFSLVCIDNFSLDSVNKEQSWKTVFLGRIKDEKLYEFYISKLREDKLWLSVATPVKKFLNNAFVNCKNIKVR